MKSFESNSTKLTYHNITLNFPVKKYITLNLCNFKIYHKFVMCYYAHVFLSWF
jgi:hypothetical protein